jgi:hypothetical protein
LLERAETEIRFALANGIFKMKMDIDRHGPTPMPNSCKNLNPPLPTTFKGQNRTKTFDSIEPRFLLACISLGAQFHCAKACYSDTQKKYMGYVLHIACRLYL